MKMRTTCLIALALAGLSNIPAAHAATATTSFQVTADVAATCSATTTNLVFGSYTSAQIDQTNTINVTCTSGTAYDITLDNGLYASGSQRRMKDAGTDYLNYDLYTDSGRTTAWQGATAVSGTGNGSAQAVTVYGRLPGSQTLYTGSYTDTIQVTITY